MDIEFTTRQLTLIQGLIDYKLARHEKLMEQKEIKEYKDIKDSITKRFEDEVNKDE